MTKVLILGANGQLARNTTRFFLDHADVHLTLYLRRASRLRNPDPSRVTIVEGDVTDRSTLEAAMKGQDAVYANLSGAMKQQAQAIINSMHATGLKRLIFISSMGIYGEVPGEQYRSVLGRVEMWRGGSRYGLSVAAPFVWRCLNNQAVTPFPHPAHRTGLADLPHPALGQDTTPSPTTGCALVRSGVRDRSTRKGARVDTSRPCVA